MPTQYTPALNHAFRFSASGETPPASAAFELAQFEDAARIVGIDTEGSMLVHMAHTRSDLGMRQQVEIPFERQRTTPHLQVGKLMVGHVVEIVVVALVLAIGRY